jgi:hypothetical protein
VNQVIVKPTHSEEAQPEGHRPGMGAVGVRVWHDSI